MCIFFDDLVLLFFWVLVEGAVFCALVKSAVLFWALVEGAVLFWALVEGAELFWVLVEGAKVQSSSGCCLR